MQLLKQLLQKQQTEQADFKQSWDGALEKFRSWKPQGSPSRAMSLDPEIETCSTVNCDISSPDLSQCVRGALSRSNQNQPWQNRVAKALMEKGRKGLLVVHPTGSGKTRSAAVAAEAYMAHEKDKRVTKDRVKVSKDRVKVIAPTVTHNQWQQELAKQGLDKQSYEVVSYASIPEECSHSMVILDEAHNFKSESRERAKKFKMCARKADKVLMLSATPAENEEELETLLQYIRAAQSPLPSEGADHDSDDDDDDDDDEEDEEDEDDEYFPSDDDDQDNKCLISELYDDEKALVERKKPRYALKTIYIPMTGEKYGNYRKQELKDALERYKSKERQTLESKTIQDVVQACRVKGMPQESHSYLMDSVTELIKELNLAKILTTTRNFENAQFSPLFDAPRTDSLEEARKVSPKFQVLEKLLDRQVLFVSRSGGLDKRLPRTVIFANLLDNGAVEYNNLLKLKGIYSEILSGKSKKKEVLDKFKAVHAEKADTQEMTRRSGVTLEDKSGIKLEDRALEDRALKNAKDQFPRVLIGTDALKEGADLQNFDQIIVLDDIIWTTSEWNQIIGRVLRFGSPDSNVRTSRPLFVRVYELVDIKKMEVDGHSSADDAKTLADLLKGEENDPRSKEFLRLLPRVEQRLLYNYDWKQSTDVLSCDRPVEDLLPLPAWGGTDKVRAYRLENQHRVADILAKQNKIENCPNS